MRPQAMVAAVILALPAAGASGVADAEAQGRMRFAAMDTNNDGRVSRDEWRGSDASFKVHDWNGDGVLSGDEVRAGARRRSTTEEDFDPERVVLRDWSPSRFRSLDRNGDGRITRNEWFYDAESFRRADRNRDNVLTRAEFLDGEADDDRHDLFIDLDHNNDGRLDETEWHGSRRVFDRLDENGDGTLTRAEVAGDQDAASADVFASLDANRDGVIERSEWQWSSVSFNGRDEDNDGVLSRDELGNATADAGAEGRAIGTAGRTIVVDARERWTDTGMVVRAGDILVFQADGRIQLSSVEGDAAEPSGAMGGRRAPDAPVKTQPAGGLIARIGESAPVYVGDRTNNRLRAPVSGRLYLGINDDHLDDNSGEFRVSVTVRR